MIPNDAINTLKIFFSQNMTPQKMFTNMIGNNNNPMISNLMQMAQKGDIKSVEQFARNFCNERNANFDDEFSKFMSNFKK